MQTYLYSEDFSCRCTRAAQYVRPGAPGARAGRPRPARARPHRVLARVQRGLDGDDELRQHRQHLGAAGLQQVLNTLQVLARVTVPPRVSAPAGPPHPAGPPRPAGHARLCHPVCLLLQAGGRSKQCFMTLAGLPCGQLGGPWSSQRRAGPLQKSGSSRAHVALRHIGTPGSSTAGPTAVLPCRQRPSRAWRCRSARSQRSAYALGGASAGAAPGGRGGARDLDGQEAVGLLRLADAVEEQGQVVVVVQLVQVHLRAPGRARVARVPPLFTGTCSRESLTKQTTTLVTQDSSAPGPLAVTALAAERAGMRPSGVRPAGVLPGRGRPPRLPADDVFHAAVLHGDGQVAALVEAPEGRVGQVGAPPVCARARRRGARPRCARRRRGRARQRPRQRAAALAHVVRGVWSRRAQPARARARSRGRPAAAGPADETHGSVGAACRPAGTDPPWQLRTPFWPLACAARTFVAGIGEYPQREGARPRRGVRACRCTWRATSAAATPG